VVDGRTLYKRKHIEAGLCAYCSRPSVLGFTRCKRHQRTDARRMKSLTNRRWWMSTRRAVLRLVKAVTKRSDAEAKALLEHLLLAEAVTATALTIKGTIKEST
jgi:hypothetical protein